MTRLAFEEGGGRRVEARIDERNTRSRAVAERLGYELEGTLKSDRRDNEGRLGGTLIYAMTDLGGIAGRVTGKVCRVRAQGEGDSRQAAVTGGNGRAPPAASV